MTDEWMYLRSDLLLRVINLRRSIVIRITLPNSVDLMVDRSTMVITILSSTPHRPLDVAGMPRTDTGHLPQPLVCLPRQLLRAPSRRNTREAMSLRNGNTIHHLVLLENTPDLNRLLKQALSKLDLLSHGPTVDLDLHQMRLLLLQRRLADLGVGEHAHDGAVFLDTLQFAGDGSAGRFGVLFGVFGEGLFLGFVPVFVEAAFYFVGEMLGPNGGEGS